MEEAEKEKKKIMKGMTKVEEQGKFSGIDIIVDGFNAIIVAIVASPHHASP